MSEGNVEVEVVESSSGQGFTGSPYPPPNYLVWAILATIFCCWPLGIPAIVFACQVNSKHESGDFSGAHDASKKAKMFSLLSTCGGLLIWLLTVLWWVLIVGLSIMAEAAN